VEGKAVPPGPMSVVRSAIVKHDSMDQKVELGFRREVNSELDASGIPHPA